MLWVSIMIRPLSRVYRTAIRRSGTGNVFVMFTAIMFGVSFSEQAFGKGEQDRLRILQTDYVVNARRKMAQRLSFRITRTG